LRGFARRGVGPNRFDNTLGGETYLSTTLEYRYPLHSITQPGTYTQVETFRLTLFTDAGVLDVNPWHIDPSEVRWTYGFGLGMVHPFPISLNFGFPILSGEGDRRETFSFTILSLWF
jgi:outer membrane protein assembly factor BamA